MHDKGRDDTSIWPRGRGKEEWPIRGCNHRCFFCIWPQGISENLFHNSWKLVIIVLQGEFLWYRIFWHCGMKVPSIEKTCSYSSEGRHNFFECWFPSCGPCYWCISPSVCCSDPSYPQAVICRFLPLVCQPVLSQKPSTLCNFGQAWYRITWV